MSSSDAFVPDPGDAARRAFQPLEIARSARASGLPQEPAPPPEHANLALKDSYERGLAEGLAKGREEGLHAAREALPLQEAEDLNAAAVALREAARGVEALRAGYLVENRKLLVDLALSVAGRILGREIAADPDALLTTVERALAALGDAEPVALRLSPEVAEAVAEERSPALAELARQHGLRIETDPRLSRADARVLADRTAVDARLETTLARIAEEWGELAERGAEVDGEAPVAAELEAGPEAGADSSEPVEDPT